jgi:hypothetical protein
LAWECTHLLPLPWISQDDNLIYRLVRTIGMKWTWIRRSRSTSSCDPDHLEGHWKNDIGRRFSQLDGETPPMWWRHWRLCGVNKVFTWIEFLDLGLVLRCLRVHGTPCKDCMTIFAFCWNLNRQWEKSWTLRC